MIMSAQARHDASLLSYMPRRAASMRSVVTMSAIRLFTCRHASALREALLPLPFMRYAVAAARFFDRQERVALH